MALKTREEYKKSLKAMKPNIYKFGELIEDVTTHPATKRVVESHARAIDASHDPKLAEDFTTTSSFISGEKIHRWNSMMETLEDIMANSRMKRWMYRLTGSCSGGCVRRLERPERYVECHGANGQGIRHEISGASQKMDYQFSEKWPSRSGRSYGRQRGPQPETITAGESGQQSAYYRSPRRRHRNQRNEGDDLRCGRL